ncbi:MAG: hypothetical protein AB1512_06815 [Thermodesulfobacteriota bacterium]
MVRTTIMLSNDLKVRAAKRASKLGMSLGEFIRKSLESSLSSKKGDKQEEDPFLADRAIFAGKAPADLSTNHDAYLYGDKR